MSRLKTKHFSKTRWQLVQKIKKLPTANFVAELFRETFSFELFAADFATFFKTQIVRVQAKVSFGGRQILEFELFIGADFDIAVNINHAEVDV